jgi:hypothetical protein
MIPAPAAPAASGKAVIGELTGALTGSVNRGGGWGYYAGKSSRLEPTCWAIHALADRPEAAVDRHRLFFDTCRRPDGLLIDLPKAPANYAYNGLALLTTLGVSGLATEEHTAALTSTLASSGGALSERLPIIRQDNMIEGWPWMDGMSNWVEPTSWCLMGLKRIPPAMRQSSVTHRIGEGEKLLIDRCCESGGWNYGNSNVLGSNLPAYVPTTAIGLMALQDRRDLPVVARSLEYLERYATREQSGMALSLALMCLRLYERPADGIAKVEAALLDQWGRTGFLGNLCTIAMALYALGPLSAQTGGLKL